MDGSGLSGQVARTGHFEDKKVNLQHQLGGKKKNG
jgi:hypothetical protein